MIRKSSITVLVLTLIGAFNQSFSMQGAPQLSCNGDYKLPGQRPQGHQHTDVERTGVMICKDYGQDDKIVNDRYAVILGHDKNLDVFMPQAGKVEQSDQYTSEAAARELEEETGGLIQLSSKTVSTLPYIYAGKKQLFFLRDDNASVRSVTNSCELAIKNPKLPSCYKEIDKATAVSVVELMRVAQGIDNGTIPQSKTYTLVSRSQGKQITIDGFYMQMFGHPHDHSRYQNARAMFNALFGVNIF